MTSPADGQRKVALIFGGSRGIGAGAASRLAQDGYAVAITYVSRPDSTQSVVETIRKAAGDAFAVQADSADAAAIRYAVDQTVERFGALDVAVVNAGVLRLGVLDAVTVEDLDESLNVNVRGVFLAIQAAARQMRDGGRIIAIGSNSAIRPDAALPRTRAACAQCARASRAPWHQPG